MSHFGVMGVELTLTQHWSQKITFQSPFFACLGLNLRRMRFHRHTKTIGCQGYAFKAPSKKHLFGHMEVNLY